MCASGYLSSDPSGSTGSACAQRTRLAPSPTGALHVGNASSFLLCWALARKFGWEITLRMEDLDGPRVSPHASQQTVEILNWLGMDWDGPVIVQSHDPQPHRDAMKALASAGLVYPTLLSRAQIAAASNAPHLGEGENHCPASLRPATMPSDFSDAELDWRFATPPGEIPFQDQILGFQNPCPADSVGDFVVWTRRQQPAYQLAVVVDDARQGITQVVRGSDLVDSTARQLLLWRALGLGREPAYWHLPLVIGTDGRRLAKRHGDTRLSTYRQEGVRPERVIGLIARWNGIMPDSKGMLSAREFAAAVSPEQIRREPIVFTEEDHQWLLNGTG